MIEMCHDERIALFVERTKQAETIGSARDGDDDGFFKREC